MKFEPETYDLALHRRMLAVSLQGPAVKVTKGGMGGGKIVEKMEECGFCHDNLKPISKCSRCLNIKYCGRECQLKHWPEHKPFCKKA